MSERAPNLLEEKTCQIRRKEHGLSVIETLSEDVQFGVRVLRKSPGFTIVAVLTLALGIGVNAWLFSIVDGVLLHPLAFPDPDELVAVHASKPNFEEGSISGPTSEIGRKTITALKRWP